MECYLIEVICQLTERINGQKMNTRKILIVILTVILIKNVMIIRWKLVMETVSPFLSPDSASLLAKYVVVE
jgi:hypothetical protein